jgi:glycosyltransferase involved in cell wall biosynthesis
MTNIEQLAAGHDSMKILLMISSMSAGGAERVACSLANAWSERGDNVIVMPTFSGRGECFFELSADVRLVYLADMVSSRARSFLNQFARLRALRRFIAKERPDITVSFLTNVNVAAVIASAGLDVPVIICERIDPFICPVSLWLNLARRLVYPFADALMVQTQAVAAKYAASGKCLRRVSVIPNPVPLEVLNLCCVPCTGGRKRLLAVGRLEGQKQFDVLIRVFARITNRHPDWSLRIIGDGPLRAELQQQIVALGLESRIELSGRIVDIGDELANADAFALTSSFEGFPNALLEAMAAGLPCVTFDCQSGPREISLDGKTALLVALNDERALQIELERLMSDEALRSSLGRLARVSVLERYSLDKVLGKWDSLFEAVGVRH